MNRIKRIVLFAAALVCTIYMVEYLASALIYRTKVKKIAVITEPSRADQRRDQLINQLREIAQKNNRLALEVISIADYNLGFLTAPIAPAQQALSDEVAQRWSSVVERADGIIFVLPNENDCYTGTMKNAIDLLWKPWHNKPTGVVGFGVNQQDSAIFLDSFVHVLGEIKADAVKPMIFVPFNNGGTLTTTEQQSINAQLRTMLDALNQTASQARYVTKTIRAVGDTIKQRFIKLLAPKRKNS